MSQPPQPPPLPPPGRPERPDVLSYSTVRPVNRDATASLVWGLLNFLPFLSGIFAVRHARRGLRYAADNLGSGRAMAHAGLVLGILNLMWSTALALAAYPMYLAARTRSDQVHCMANLRQIGLACMTYATQNNGVLPPNLTTLTTAGVLPAPPSCPAGARSGGTPAPYVYLLPHANLKTLRPAATTVLAYDPPANHPNRGAPFLFADGHVEWLPNPGAAAVIARLTAPPATAPTQPAASSDSR